MLDIDTKNGTNSPALAIVNGGKMSEGVSLKEVLSECIDMIVKLCKRAHPKRDLKDGLYQFGVISLVDI